MYDPKVLSINIVAESAKGTAHPPVFISMPLKPNQGELPAGLVLAKSASGLVPWTKAEGEIIAGVLNSAVDTDMQDNGLVIVHGSAVSEIIKVGVDGSAPDDKTFSALISLGVYPE